MPRVFSIDMVEDLDESRFDDRKYDPYAVPPPAFQYISPPELGGPQGEVRVAVRPEQVGTIKNGPGMFDQYRQSHPQQQTWQAETEHFVAELAAEMAKLGLVRLYVRYDGGNDEGFAWFDRGELPDGSVRNAEQIARDLEAVKLARPAWAAKRSMQDVLDDAVAQTWANTLLTDGFGTGEMVLYGAFSVDLASGVVIDDPDPAPVVRNITLGDA